MQLGVRIFPLLLLVVAVGDVASARAQELNQDPFVQAAAVDRLVWPDEPPPSPVPYRSPLATIYFSAEFAAFNREQHGSTILTSRNTTTNVIITDLDVDHSYEPGLRALLGARLTDYTALEVSYLGLMHWDDTQVVRDTSLNVFGVAGNQTSPLSTFGNPLTVGLDYNQLVTARVQTDFNSLEANFRQELEFPYSTVRVSAIYGTRYLHLRDRFEYRSRSLVPLLGGTLNAADVAASNNLFGVQLGGAMEMHIERRAWFNVELKGMILHNSASQQSQYAVGPLAAPVATAAGERSQDRVAFGGDIQAVLVWQFTPRLLGRLGYQAVHLTGMALGADNFYTNLPALTVAPGELNREGEITLHGPFAGLTYTW